MSEEQFNMLMKQLAAGDREALSEIYKAYMKLIYSVCLNILKQKEAAEDVSADFFIRLFKSAATFDGRGHHKTWMITIARNMCIDYLRKNSHETISLDAPMGFSGGAGQHSMDSSEGDTGTSIKDTLKDKQNVEDTVVKKLSIEMAMKILSQTEKDIVDMKIEGGMTFKEIAEVLGKPQGTVSWQYNEAIKKMRRCLYER